MSYREYIFNICNQTDFEDSEEATLLARILTSEAVRKHDICMEYDRKLKELMSAEDFEAFSTEVAKRIFRQEIENMEDCEFKEFVMENFEEITK